MKKIIIIIVFISSSIVGMQTPLDQTLRQSILTCINQRDEITLSKLITANKITAVDSEIAQAAQDEFKVFATEPESKIRFLSSPAGGILIMINRLAPKGSELPFSNEPVFGIPEDYEEEDK